MTQINTILSRANNINYLFSRSIDTNGFSDSHEGNVVNNILGYLSLNRSKDDLINNAYCPFTYKTVCIPYYRSTITKTLQDISKDTIVICRATPSNLLKEEEVKVEGFVELNTASCPLNQFLTVGKNTVRVFQTKTPEGNYSNVVFVHDLTEVFFDKLFSSIPKLIPSLYPNGEIPQDELDVFKSLAKSDYETVEKIINAKCQELNVPEVILRKTFEGYENTVVERQKRLIKSDLNDYEEDYDNLVTSLRETLEKINNKRLLYDALCNHKPQNTTSFVDFLLSHKNIIKCERDGEQIYYIIDETIEYFADDMFESYYGNEGCEFMRVAEPDTKIILKGLFLKQYGKLRVYSEFFSDALTTLEPLNSGNIIGVDYSDHFGHPHLGRYGCLGANQLPIANYLKDGEWDMAIEQSIAATKNLNFGDGTVMVSFVKDMNRKLTDNGKYIIANNGQLMTLKEFAQYVEQLEKEETQPEEKKEDEQTN